MNILKFINCALTACDPLPHPPFLQTHPPFLVSHCILEGLLGRWKFLYRSLWILRLRRPKPNLISGRQSPNTLRKSIPRSRLSIEGIYTQSLSYSSVLGTKLYVLTPPPPPPTSVFWLSIVSWFLLPRCSVALKFASSLLVATLVLSVYLSLPLFSAPDYLTYLAWLFLHMPCSPLSART